MGKKQKAKDRLDKYYYLAKEHGFRSRAAFKLIQLNKKFHFLETANVLIDLCAAPGGWCQVAAKQMPVSSIKIGVDLDPIKPIPGVTTFKADITTDHCRHLIRKEIKHFKADVVLNDGAPNVGGVWAKDSFSQTELVLYAVKLATDFLREGGWFITKVFRSSDYNSLIYVMRQLFGKVEATKPLASRSQAAEIFVVCSQYKAPNEIDPKLLDPKYALKQLEEEDEMKSNTVKSIKAIFDKKKHRGGYNTESLFNVKSFKDFIECSNPYQFITETNKIEIRTDECKQYIELVRSPSEFKLYFSDIQLLGKKEVQEWIIWRNKIRGKWNVMNKKEKVKDKEENAACEPDEKKEKKEIDINEEMDTEWKKFEKQRKKKKENELRKLEKQRLKSKKDFIEQEEGLVDNDVDFDQNLFEHIQKHNIDIEALEAPEEEDEKEDNEGEFQEFNLSELSEDDYIDMMNEDIEENKKMYEEEKGMQTKKVKIGKKNKEDDIEFVPKDNEEVNEDKNEYSGSDSEQGDNSSDYDEESEISENGNISNEDIDWDEDKDDDDDKKDDIKIVNPLRKHKNVDTESKDVKMEIKEEEALSSDTDDEGGKAQKEKKKSLLNKKTKRDNNTNNSSNKIEGDESEGIDSSSEDDGYNTDEKAEIRAIAKKMLRKKDRLKILDNTYNRYAFKDSSRVPKWFTEEEKQHAVPNKPVSKAEILAEKSILKKFNDRVPKKILQAKARKRNKLNKRLDKVKKKAEVIANQEEIAEFSKVRQIEKWYKRELSRNKEKKKYIVSRSFNNNSGRDRRNVRHVDRRLKKDKRAEKNREKKGGKGGKKFRKK